MWARRARSIAVIGIALLFPGVVLAQSAMGGGIAVDLRPATYSVTFTLAGLSTGKREGIGLTTGFTATANAPAAVGSSRSEFLFTA